MGVVCKKEEELQIILQKYMQGVESNYDKIVKNCLSMKSKPTQTIFNYLQSII